MGPTFVRDAWRGKGLQRKLINARLRFARRHGFVRVISSVNWDNFRSGNNLIRCGFVLCERWLDQVGLYFEKRL